MTTELPPKSASLDFLAQALATLLCCESSNAKLRTEQYTNAQSACVLLGGESGAGAVVGLDSLFRVVEETGKGELLCAREKPLLLFEFHYNHVALALYNLGVGVAGAAGEESVLLRQQRSEVLVEHYVRVLQLGGGRLARSAQQLCKCCAQSSSSSSTRSDLVQRLLKPLLVQQQHSPLPSSSSSHATPQHQSSKRASSGSASLRSPPAAVPLPPLYLGDLVTLPSGGKTGVVVEVVDNGVVGRQAEEEENSPRDKRATAAAATAACGGGGGVRVYVVEDDAVQRVDDVAGLQVLLHGGRDRVHVTTHSRTSSPQQPQELAAADSIKARVLVQLAIKSRSRAACEFVARLTPPAALWLSAKELDAVVECRLQEDVVSSFLPEACGELAKHGARDLARSLLARWIARCSSATAAAGPPPPPPAFKLEGELRFVRAHEFLCHPRTWQEDEAARWTVCTTSKPLERRTIKNKSGDGGAVLQGADGFATTVAWGDILFQLVVEEEEGAALTVCDLRARGVDAFAWGAGPLADERAGVELVLEGRLPVRRTSEKSPAAGAAAAAVVPLSETFKKPMFGGRSRAGSGSPVARPMPPSPPPPMTPVITATTTTTTPFTEDSSTPSVKRTRVEFSAPVTSSSPAVSGAVASAAAGTTPIASSAAATTPSRSAAIPVPARAAPKVDVIDLLSQENDDEDDEEEEEKTAKTASAAAGDTEDEDDDDILNLNVVSRAPAATASPANRNSSPVAAATRTAPAKSPVYAAPPTPVKKEEEVYDLTDL